MARALVDRKRPLHAQSGLFISAARLKDSFSFGIGRADEKRTALPRSQTLDLLNFRRLQTKFKDVQIRPHMLGVGGSG